MEPLPDRDRFPFLERGFLAAPACRGTGGEIDMAFVLASRQHGQIEAAVCAEGEQIAVFRGGIDSAVEADGDALRAVQDAVRQLQVSAVGPSCQAEHRQHTSEDRMVFRERAAPVAAPDDPGEPVPRLVRDNRAADPGEVVMGQYGRRRWGLDGCRCSG